MRGDFTRDSFDAGKHYSRVLMQQGRVLVDDDWNTQSAIHLHYLRALATDIIGQHGGPSDGTGFAVAAGGGTLGPFTIGKGHYYVDGILCENGRDDVAYRNQPHLPTQAMPVPGTHLVYLDVWERHVTSADDALLREVALGGPDTATRAQVVWQVRLFKLDQSLPAAPTPEQFKKIFDRIRPGPIPRLSAQAVHDDLGGSPCTISPDARYTGPENQLYRVEVHRGGTATTGGATFKWSRDNAARGLFPIRTPFTGDYVIAQPGRDERTNLAKGEWVELIDDDGELNAVNDRPLLQVAEVVEADGLVVLRGSPGPVQFAKLIRPMLRRWDQTAVNHLLDTGDIAVVEDEPIELEDGVRIRFEKGGRYHPGMYWLIPARVETGDVEWPRTTAGPEFRPPRGVEHHFAPLAEVTVANGAVTGTVDHRRRFKSLCELTALTAHL
ncbi:DUF6519 domain-containing protein [Streptomyces sp. NPDC001530]|uniref:DUF6519 domain-containing protein n=1 Tax=Streptomyces sp. NPDC001530 TaxID=3364582 RepID=UPI0036D19A19